MSLLDIANFIETLTYLGISNEELSAAVCLMDMYWGIFLIINLCGWILSAVTRAIV